MNVKELKELLSNFTEDALVVPEVGLKDALDSIKYACLVENTIKHYRTLYIGNTTRADKWHDGKVGFEVEPYNSTHIKYIKTWSKQTGVKEYDDEFKMEDTDKICPKCGYHIQNDMKNAYEKEWCPACGFSLIK